ARRDRDPRRAADHPSARNNRPGAVVRGASAGAVRFARDTSRRVGQEIRRRRGHRHAIAPGRLPRRFASRLPRAVASGSGIRIDERSRLRRAGRCESARRADAGAPAHPSAAGEAQGSCRDHGGSRDPGLGPGRGDHRPSAAGLGPAPMKPWHFGVLWLVLFIVAVSTGVELLSYLSYLVLFVFIAMSILSRLTLEGLSVKRTIGQSYAHLGDTIELAYELTNDHWLGKLWLEVFEKSNWPEPLTGRVLSIGGHKTRKWKVLELDRTADLWIYLDLDGRWHHGDGEDSTEERAVTVAASVVRKALDGHRNVGLVTNGNRAEVLHPDRGTKQFGKLMQYLAEVHASGTRTLQETLVETLPRLRRGASCLLITPSLDRAWVRLASTLRETAIATQAVLVSPPFDLDERDRARRRAILGELAVARVPAAHLAAGAPLEELFHQST